MTGPSIALVLVLWLASPPGPTNGHVDYAAQRLTAWYAHHGVTVTVTEQRIETLVADPCADQGWWRSVPREPGVNYVYIVDTDCAIFHDRYGVASRSRQVAVVSLRFCPFDPLLTHEVAHLLGAPDQPDSPDLMGACFDRAYVEGLLSQATWAAMGGLPPDYLVTLPLMEPGW
jgi:hypothetical protein